jgi:excisionase family DNA binding protein
MDKLNGREPLLVSKREAAAALSISVRTLENLIFSKKLPVRKIGRRALVPYSALRALASHDTSTGSTKGAV